MPDGVRQDAVCFAPVSAKPRCMRWRRTSPITSRNYRQPLGQSLICKHRRRWRIDRLRSRNLPQVPAGDIRNRPDLKNGPAESPTERRQSKCRQTGSALPGHRAVLAAQMQRSIPASPCPMIGGRNTRRALPLRYSDTLHGAQPCCDPVADLAKVSSPHPCHANSFQGSLERGHKRTCATSISRDASPTSPCSCWSSSIRWRTRRRRANPR